MILSLLKRLLNNTLYVIVRENSFTLVDPNTEIRQDYQSVEPFSSARLAISNFQRAESFLKTSVNDFYSKGILSPSPKMIMHQVHRNEGGLGQVEMRVLREVAFSAGAREVFVWQGTELTKEELVSESYV